MPLPPGWPWLPGPWWHDDWPGITVHRISGRSQTVDVDEALAELGQRIEARKQQAAVGAAGNCGRGSSAPD